MNDPKFRPWLLRAAIPEWHRTFDKELYQCAIDIVTHSLGKPLDHPLTQMFLRNAAFENLAKCLENDAVFLARMSREPYPSIEEQDRWVNQKVDEILAGELKNKPKHSLTIDTRNVTIESLLTAVNEWCLTTPNPPYTLTIISTQAETTPTIMRFFRATDLLTYLTKDLSGVKFSRDSQGLTLEGGELENKGLFNDAILAFDGPLGGGGTKTSIKRQRCGIHMLTLLSHSSGNDEINCGIRELKHVFGVTKKHFSVIRRESGLPLDTKLTPMELRSVFNTMRLSRPDTPYKTFSVTCAGTDPTEFENWIENSDTSVMLYFEPGKPDQSPDPQIAADEDEDSIASLTPSACRSSASFITRTKTREREALMKSVGGARRQRSSCGHYWLVINIERQSDIDIDKECCNNEIKEEEDIEDDVTGTYKRKTKRGIMMYDIETREATNITRIVGSRSWHPQVPTILCVAYQTLIRDGAIGPDYTGGVMHKRFESVPAPRVIPQLSPIILSCVDQFLRWLLDMSSLGLNFNIYAHNGGGFDHRFLLDAMTAVQVQQAQLLLRGHTIVKMEYSTHIFRDTCLILQAPLDMLCSSFGVDVSKQTSFTLHGQTISNTQLCFYKPEISIAEFLKLSVTDKEFWDLYVSYCDKDCHSLLLVWRKFCTAYKEIVISIDPNLLCKCAASTSTTVGSMAMKLFTEAAKIKSPHAFSLLELTHEGAHGAAINVELRKYVRGGISHCNGSRAVYDGVTGYDITSQYPAALMDADIPVGKAEILDSDDYELDLTQPGFYQVINAVWSQNCPKFLPVTRDDTSTSNYEPRETSLNWAENPTSFRASFSKLQMLVRLGWLVSYDLRSGVVFQTTVKGSLIFGDTVNALYAEKRRQDIFKSSNDPNFNPVLRFTVKLLLNAFTGKLVENTGKYRNLTSPGDDSQPQAFIGRGQFVYSNAGRINTLLTAGLCVYEQSKIILFERYVTKLPGGPDVVYAVETDGFYVPSSVVLKFESEITQFLNTGKLGSLVREKQTEAGLFLGKKAYALLSIKQLVGEEELNRESLIRLKGISLYVTQPDGTKKSVISHEVLTKLSLGESVTLEIDMWDHELVKRCYTGNLGTHIDSGPRRSSRVVKFERARFI